MEEKENEVITPEIITPEEGEKLSSTISDFVESYTQRPETTSNEEWLFTQFRVHLPEKSDEELTQIQSEIIDGLHEQEKSKQSLDEAISKGRSKESWFTDEMQYTTSA